MQEDNDPVDLLQNYEMLLTVTPPLPVGVALAGTATGAVGGAFVASSSWPFWRDDLNCPSPAPVVPVSPGTGERERCRRFDVLSVD